MSPVYKYETERRELEAIDIAQSELEAELFNKEIEQLKKQLVSDTVNRLSDPIN
jgi:hypothetical protein